MTGPECAGGGTPLTCTAAAVAAHGTTREPLTCSVTRGTPRPDRKEQTAPWAYSASSRRPSQSQRQDSTWPSTAVTTTAMRLPCRMFRAGYRKGFEEGHAAGYADGYAYGYSAGYSAGSSSCSCGG